MVFVSLDPEGPSLGEFLEIQTRTRPGPRIEMGYLRKPHRALTAWWR